MSEHETEQPHDDDGGRTGQPDDEQLPGHRDEGPDPDPVDAAEDDGSASAGGVG